MTEHATCTCPSCGWIGTDDLPRVCEVCGADEPDGDQHDGVCPACGKNTWWIPKCPACGTGCDWDKFDQEAPRQRELI